MTGPWLGSHVSAAGGLERVFERAAAVGAQAIQLFTRNQRQWAAKPLTPAEIDAFQTARRAWPYSHVASHASYLINPATADDELATKSVAALAEELQRCEALGIPLVVLHPGAHGGRGPADEAAGIARVAARLDAALSASGTTSVRLLLENTAGQGTALGGSFGHLGAIMAASGHGQRLGVCLDTCHAFAAGHELRTPQGLDATLTALDQALPGGLQRLALLHLNDSAGDLGQHKDRHAHIGQGRIGLDGFELLLNHPRLRHLPMVLETPKDQDGELDRRNLATLRSLLH